MFHMKHSLVIDGLFNCEFLTSTIVSHETIIRVKTSIRSCGQKTLINL